MDFLFHKISDKEKTDIQKQVDSILKSFSEKLSQVQETEIEYETEIKEFERNEEGEPLFVSRKIMFENAPEKNDDSIIAERKTW